MWHTHFAFLWSNPLLYRVDSQGEFWVWTQPMRDDVTLQRHFSLAEPIPRMLQGFLHAVCDTEVCKIVMMTRWWFSTCYLYNGVGVWFEVMITAQNHHNVKFCSLMALFTNLTFYMMNCFEGFRYVFWILCNSLAFKLCRLLENTLIENNTDYHTCLISYVLMTWSFLWYWPCLFGTWAHMYLGLIEYLKTWPRINVWLLKNHFVFYCSLICYMS